MDYGTYNASKRAMFPIFKAGYEASQALLTQGEPVAYVEMWGAQEFNSKHIQCETKILEKLPVGTKLYTVLPSTEALQKENTELIEYVRNIEHKLLFLKAYSEANDYSKIKNVKVNLTEKIAELLAIPQAKCMGAK